MGTAYIPLEGLPNPRIESIKRMGRTSGFATKDRPLYMVKLINGENVMVPGTQNLDDGEARYWGQFLGWPICYLEEVPEVQTTITYKIREEK